MQAQVRRPIGITILAILAFIFGILGIIGGLGLISLGGAATGIGAATGAGGAVAGGGVAFVLGILTLFSSVLSVAFAVGAWGLKPWAWTLGVGAEALALIGAVLGLGNEANRGSSIFSILVAAGILFYLFTPTVKRAFGRA